MFGVWFQQERQRPLWVRTSSEFRRYHAYSSNLLSDTVHLGPSGAGKTTLLNILAGRTVTSGRVTVEADVRLDNHVVNPAAIEIRQQIAFVAQDDSLMISATPRESIRFSARLRLSKDTSEDELDALTTSMLQELGLEKCADTLVGGALLKGISGGERKRTSVGVELVTKPNMVFLDEPTSGLDSFSAVQLCQVLKKVATAGASVLFTIHQPSSDIFESFDRLIMMNAGRIMYQGPVNVVDEYFGAREHPLPPKYNPADWIMIVAQSVSEEDLEAQGFFEKDPRPEVAVSEQGVEGQKAEKEKHVGFCVQLGMLFRRDVIAVKRDKQILVSRLMLTSFSGVLMGIIFWQVGKSDSANFTVSLAAKPLCVDGVTSFANLDHLNLSEQNLQSHFGSEIMILMASMLGTALPALIVFPRERPVFIREYSTNHYSIVAYILARLAMEAILTGIQMLLLCTLSYFMIGFQMQYHWHLLITYALAMSSNALAVLVGSATEDPTMAVEFLPMCFIPQLLFAGFFVNPDLIPAWLRWLQYVFPLTYAVRLHLEKEFADCGSEQAQMNCDTLLSNVGVNSADIWFYWLMLILLFLLLRLGALAALRKKASKFY